MVAAPQSPSSASEGTWGQMRTNAAQGRVVFEWRVFPDRDTETTFYVDAGRPDGQALNERQFRELADRWYRETGGQSAPARVVSNEAYLAIIGMRERALPLILSDLRKHGGYWYPALRAICSAIGIAPPVIPPEARGNVARMVDAWLSWGTARGYLA